MGDSTKIDLKKQIGTYSARRGTYSLVTVPGMQFLMVDGHGDPNTSRVYADALASLYPLAYAVKFLSKRELGRDYVVMPLEGLWWSQEMDAFTAARDKSRWDWTLMTVLPNWVTSEHVEAARGTVAGRGGAPVLESVRLEEYDEGLAVQTLHVGPYDDEGPVLDAMHRELIPGHGLQMTGKHHEIYLSDARRAAPDKLRTILRQPVTDRLRPCGEGLTTDAQVNHHRTDHPASFGGLPPVGGSAATHDGHGT